MNFQLIESDSSPSGELPFAEDFLLANPKKNKQVYTITSAILAKKGTGIMLFTEFFKYFVFKNDKRFQNVLSQLEPEDGLDSPTMLLRLNKDCSTKSAELGFDAEQPLTWMRKDNVFTISERLSF